MGPRKSLHFPNIFQIRSFEVQPSLRNSHKFLQPNPTMDMMRSNHRECIFSTKNKKKIRTWALTRPNTLMGTTGQNIWNWDCPRKPIIYGHSRNKARTFSGSQTSLSDWWMSYGVKSQRVTVTSSLLSAFFDIWYHLLNSIDFSNAFCIKIYALMAPLDFLGWLGSELLGYIGS